MGILAGCKLLVGIFILCIAISTSIKATSSSTTTTETTIVTTASSINTATTNSKGTVAANPSFHGNMNPTSASSKLTTTMNLDEHGTLQVHAPNESVPVAINDIGLFQAMSMMIHCMKTPCPPQHYRTGCEELMSAGNCTRCPLCPPNKYRSGCGGASEGVCLNVTTCDHGEFEVRVPTPTSDRFCAAPLCSVNEFEILPMTTSTSRQCAVLSECTMTEFEALAPTLTTDRQCTTLTTCNVTEFETNAPTPTTDRQCESCSIETNRILDCADLSSRAAITSNRICEVARVDNCCCDEFSALRRVCGDVNVRSDETMLHFGTIREVDGRIKGYGESENDRGALQLVEFGKVSRVGGIVQLWYNHITRLNFGVLSRIDGFLSLDRNSLTSIDFSMISHIGGYIGLNNNALTSIDFGAMTKINGWLFLLSNALTSIDFNAITEISGSVQLQDNDLTSIKFGAITGINGHLRVYNNPSLNSINCQNMGGCLCRSSYTTPIGCPSRCTGSVSWISNCV